MVTVPVRTTYQDLCELLPDETRCELIEGELLMSPSPSRFHQDAIQRLNEPLLKHVKQNNLGVVYFAPLDVVLSDYDVVQPDILFVSNLRRDILKDKNIQGAPDLAVEIISPGSRERDRLIKKGLYARYGVQEYWLVDLEKKAIEVLSLKKGAYQLVAIFSAEDTLSTPLFPTLALPVGSVFEGR